MSRPPRRIIALDEHQRALAAAIKAWLQMIDPRPHSGAIIIAQYEDGYSVQYIGSEQLDTEQLLERVQWIAADIRKTAPVPPRAPSE